MRRRTRLSGLVLVTGGLAALAAPRDVTAGGTIDTTGTLFEIGSAPTVGTVTNDAAASLGAVPAIDDMVDPEFPPEDPARYHHDMSEFGGLGGPDFHATADVTLPGGTYDYGRYTVDPGVTVTYSGPAFINAADDARIDGRIEFAQPMNCQMHFGGDLTIVGHTGAVQTGIYAPSGDTWIWMSVEGALDISADAGATVQLGATDHAFSNHQLTFNCDAGGMHRVSSATLDGVSFDVAGDLDVQDCTGRRAILAAYDGAVTLSGGSIDRAHVFAHGDIAIQDATIGQLEVSISGGGLAVTGASVIGSGEGNVSVWTHGDVTTDDTTVLGGQAIQVYAIRGKIVLGDGTNVGGDGPSQNTTPGAWGIGLYAWDGVEIGGKLDAGVTDWNQIHVYRGDIVLRDGAELRADGGYVQFSAEGTVSAAGGTAIISAGEIEARSVTGDLDLDVASMTTTTGPIVALTNGVVKLRGTFTSARDVEILSRKDAIDVSGATIRTADAGAASSGFVRLATYASTATIDASSATFRTGSSDSASGDIMLQIAASGGETAQAAMKIARVDARQTPAGVVTRIRGTIATARQRLDLTGAGAITAGRVSRRMFLTGGGAKLRGAADGASLAFTRSGTSRAAFVLTVRETDTTAGERAPVAFDRAGLHVRGSFRRPRVK